jgi:hypothetical protein
VPWILKWHYELHNDLVSRHFSIKWWDKFKHDQIISQVNAGFPLAKANLQKPTKSGISVSSLPIEGKSRAELKEQLMIQISQIGADEDEDNESLVIPASSEAFSSQPVNKNWANRYYQDAQNPFKDLNAD